MPMQCQECGKRPATLHYTKIINGEKSQFHLCEVCAQEHGEAIPGWDHNFSIHQLLSGFLNLDSTGQGSEEGLEPRSQVLRCSTCGLTYNQFGKIGRFGCSDCYATFGKRLSPLFRRVHGHTTHRGKVPARTGGKLKLRREIEQLKLNLERCVQREEFEEAARLRDQIRTLKQKVEEEA